MPFEREPQFFKSEKGPEEIEEKKLEEKVNESKKEIFKEAGEHSPEVFFKKMRDLRGILENEKEKGEGKLRETIDEIRESPDGEESFVDKSVVYLPKKGEAIFVGDLHGDSEAVESIVEQTKFIEEMEKGGKDKYLVFLGDYADRGKKDVATVEEVMNLKLKYAQNVVLLRGNHEEKMIGMSYGFYRSLVEKYGEEKGRKLFEKYNEVVEEMPGIVVTGNGIVGVHGGIPSQEINSLKDLNEEKILYQMRSNDPTEETAERKNSERGDPIFKLFGQEAFGRFMEKIGGKKMIRSHEVIPEGSKEIFNGKLVTIFSNGSEESPSSRYKHRVRQAMFVKARLDQDKISLDFYKILYKKPAKEREVKKPPQIEKKISIAEAKDFKELFKALKQIEGLQGREKFYTSLELIRLINKVRAGEADILVITRTSDLRVKVRELLEKEKSK